MFSPRYQSSIKSLDLKMTGYNPAMSKHYQSILAYSISDEAKFRLEVINHFHQFGLGSTQGAYKVSRATIYRWQKQFKNSSGQLQSLVPKSRVPKRKRHMNIDPRVFEFIKKIRELHCRIGKDKIKPLLDEYCKELGINSIAESTIGKVIKRNNFFFSKTNYRIYHNPNRRHRKKIKRLRVKKAESVIGRIQIDTIERIDHGIKEYFYCAIDSKTKFALTLNYQTKNSRNTVDFWQKFKSVYPLKINSIQTDNGLEFLGDFDQRLKQEGIEHLFIYPRCPKINGFVERANRSLREEFLNQNQELILDDFGLFNQKLLDYLFWYNTQRPHQSLNFLSPINYWLKRYPESQMYVTSTRIVFLQKKYYYFLS